MRAPASPETTPPTRLIHIGPHKTGTTTLQRALEHHHEELARLGVHYVRPRQQTTRGVTAAGGALGPGAEYDARLAEWEQLVAAARGQPRVVLSNEFLCEATDAGIHRVVGDLTAPDGSVPHVVVTLRPLAKILSSQWQQFVQSGTTTRFGPWLDDVLGDARSPEAQLFWRRHSHAALVERWAAVVGVDNLTVVVVDGADAARLPEVFAELIGVPVELVTRAGGSRTNRSLTAHETEALRRFNQRLERINRRRVEAGQAPVEIEVNRRLGAWERLKRRAPSEEEYPLHLPARAHPKVAELARETVRRIGASGVRVRGDLDALVGTPAGKRPGPNHPATLPADLAGTIAASLLDAVTD